MPKAEANQTKPGFVAHLTVDDTRAALAFYKKAFGATEIACFPTPDGKKIMHGAFMVNGAMVMINDDFPEYCDGKSRTPRALGGSPVTLHLNLPDVDAAWERAVKAGAQVTMPLADQFWGDRYGTLRDPFGHDWSMSTPGKRQPSEEEIAAGAEKAFARPGKKWPASKPAAAAGPGKKAGTAAPARAKKR